jgi:thiamine-monophosphate kinase
LRSDQKTFGVTLVGGDTVATPGPLTLNVAAVGEVASGKMLRRAGAKAGDDVWVSGSIGDATLGLALLKGETLNLPERGRSALIARYRVPEPRVGLGPRLIAIAHACLDVSDGLVADLGHIADVSKVAIEVQAADVPLSPAARAVLVSGGATLSDLLTGGDDYELAFAAPPSNRARIAALAVKSKVPLTRIGHVAKGKGVRILGPGGAPLPVARAGYTHF